jgi:catechol 2,3-dioxygenase-like lactoylglutathione lyase family enzyme
MALTSLLNLEIAVPDPDNLADFWLRRGMTATQEGVLGTADRPSQLRLKEGDYRRVSEMRVGCESERDLDDVAGRLSKLGIQAQRGDGLLRCADPILDHDVVIEVADAPPLTPPAPRVMNRPGLLNRLDRRSTACVGEAPSAPRRVGHVVFGTTDVKASRDFYVDGLGFKVSDAVGNGLAYFLRCSSDHHNLLISPSPVPCMNHYAIEMDDVDAIGLAGTRVLQERPDCGVTGIGRHVVGANLFWYLLDPAGGMFEFFADMDQITDDAHWEAAVRRDDWEPRGIAAWQPSPPEADFFLPRDLAAIAKGREAAGR